MSTSDRQECVEEFARRWEGLPLAVQQALRVIREHESEGAYNPTLLADPVRGFFRQHPKALEE